MDYELLIAQESELYDKETDPAKKEKILKCIKVLQEMQAGNQVDWKDDRTLTPKERFKHSLAESGPQVVTGLFGFVTAAFGFAGIVSTNKSNERIAQIRESSRLEELKVLMHWEETNNDLVSDRSLKTVNELNK